MKRISRLLVFLFALGLLAWAPGVHAEYEITGVDTGGLKIGPIVQWRADVVVSWTKPTLSGGDVLQGFVYKWNTSPGALSDVDLSATANDGMVVDDFDFPSLTKPAADFANDDSNLLRYLHIKTWFLDVSSNQATYSADTVIGPINIDNVAPTGTVRITDADGNDITETRNTNLNLKLSASLAPVKMYLSENSTRPTTGAAFFSEAAYQLDNIEPGTKTIYAWFEDSVGNISSAPDTDTVMLLGPVSISPYQAVMDLTSASSQVFAVEGSSETGGYNWQIIEAAPENIGDTVAEFSGDSAATDSVTVSALNPGTFKLQATPSDGTGDVLTSGTIAIVRSAIKGDVNSDNQVDSGDAILVLRYSVGLTTLTNLQLWAGNVTNKAIDSHIDSGDAIKILRFSVGLISDLN